MSTNGKDLLIDPEAPGRLAPPDRVHYAEGVLLDAGDFAAEQTYHRTRLARTLAYLHGPGTVAGLRVVWDPALAASDDQPGRDERLRLEPGLAIDRLGRIIEVPRSACVALERWYGGEGASDLNAALNETAGGVVVDVFLRFDVCERGKTPAFAVGPFDALDAAVPSRLRDAYHVDLVLRPESDPPLPADPWADIDPEDSVEDARDALQEAILNGWSEPADTFHGGGIEPGAEHVPGQDGSAVFLARVVLPATAPEVAGEPPARTGADVSVSHLGRQFVYPAGALRRFLGF